MDTFQIVNIIAQLLLRSYSIIVICDYLNLINTYLNLILKVSVYKIIMIEN